VSSVAWTWPPAAQTRTRPSCKEGEIDILIRVIVEATKVDKAKLVAVIKQALKFVGVIGSAVVAAKLILEAVLQAVQ
jgi:hypothetical protein